MDSNNDLQAIGRRLNEYMTNRPGKLGLNQLGRMSGTSGAQIHNIIKGKKYGVDKIINILKVCPDLNVNWLLFGVGEGVQSISTVPGDTFIHMGDNFDSDVITKEELTIKLSDGSIKAGHKVYSVIERYSVKAKLELIKGE